MRIYVAAADPRETSVITLLYCGLDQEAADEAIREYLGSEEVLSMNFKSTPPKDGVVDKSRWREEDLPAFQMADRYKVYNTDPVYIQAFLLEYKATY